jgi:hypothetical protein
MRPPVVLSRAACAAAALLGLTVGEPAAAGPDLPDRARLEQLSGTWASPAPEPWYGAWGTREFTFDRGTWSLRFTLALDPAMAQPVFRFRTGGPYRLLERSTAAPAAFEAVFFEDTKHVTLLSTEPRLAAAFGLAACGLVPGQEADISAEGCARWKPVRDCREDHDLLGMDADGGLLFGVRPRDNDMCTADRRPTALLPPVVRR